jgi:hypothetical protein
VTSAPVLTAVAVLSDGRKELLALELCGSESGQAWKGFVDDVKACGLRAPGCIFELPRQAGSLRDSSRIAKTSAASPKGRVL